MGIGTALGNVVSRIEDWRRQRDELAAEVRQVVTAGTQLLSELGHDANVRATEFISSVRKGKGGRPKGYKMSAATRRKLRQAWARRKAAGAAPAASTPARKPAAAGSRGRGRRPLSAEARERIAAAQRKRWAAYRAGKK
jgi:hypothetical protein